MGQRGDLLGFLTLYGSNLKFLLLRMSFAASAPEVQQWASTMSFGSFLRAWVSEYVSAMNRTSTAELSMTDPSLPSCLYAQHVK